MKLEREIKRGYFPLDTEFIKSQGLRLARYPGYLLNGSEDGVVVYKSYDQGKLVVYSALNRKGLSSINASDRIAKSLLEEDPAINVFTYRFYDIQTNRGYRHIPKGKYHITLIKFRENKSELFTPYIGLSEIPSEFRLIIPVLANP